MKSIETKFNWLIKNLEELKHNAVVCKARHKKMHLNTIFLNAAIYHFSDILKHGHCLECDKLKLEHDLPALKILKKNID